MNQELKEQAHKEFDDLTKFKEAYYRMITHTEIDRKRMNKAQNIDEAFVLFCELSHYLKQVFIEHLSNVYKTNLPHHQQE